MDYNSAPNEVAAPKWVGIARPDDSGRTGKSTTSVPPMANVLFQFRTNLVLNPDQLGLNYLRLKGEGFTKFG